MVLIMVVVVCVTLVNLFIKFNCKDLLTSVKLHVARSVIVFSGLLCRTTFFVGIALLNSILLQMSQNKIEASPPALSVSLAEYLQILKKLCFICNGKHISDNYAYNVHGIGRCEMNWEKESLIERSKYYEESRRVGYIEPRIGLIFLVIDNPLILLLSIYIFLSFLI